MHSVRQTTIGDHAINDALGKVKPEDLNFDAAVSAILAARVADGPGRLAPPLSRDDTARMLDVAGIKAGEQS